MALSVVEQYELKDDHGETVVMGTRHNGNSGICCLKSDLRDFPKAISELSSGVARNQAIEEMAKLGLPDPRVDPMSLAPYPVDSKGFPITRPTEQKIDHYQVDIPMTKRLV